MAGHSQFKNIMYRKGAQDAKRAKIFTKIAREITVAVKESGEDLATNPRLRLAIQKARAANMPKDNVDRAIKKAAGADTENYENVRYEGHGVGGVAVIVEALTDNRNRTGGNVRAYFSKNGGLLGETGCVTYNFNHVGEIKYPQTLDFEMLMEQAIEAGAEDCYTEEDSHVILTAFEDLGSVAKQLEEKIGSALSVNAIWKPNTPAPIDAEKAEKIFKLINALEDDDDVQNVYSNFELSDADMQHFAQKD